MKRPRKHIPLKTKLAAALLQMRSDDGAYLFDYEHSKMLSADQIISLFQWDHGILHAFDGSDEPWNLTPRFIGQHREKSKRDTAIVAKTKRIRGETCTGPSKAIPSRPFPKVSRKIASRGFERRP